MPSRLLRTRRHFSILWLVLSLFPTTGCSDMSWQCTYCFPTNVSHHRVQCTYCGADTEDNFTPIGIAIAIFCFPIGSVRSFISLTIHWIKCHHIDFSSSQVLPSPTVNFSQQTLFILPLNHNWFSHLILYDQNCLVCNVNNSLFACFVKLHFLNPLLLRFETIWT